MPECTPQEDNLLFPRRGFQGPAHAHFRAGNSVWISTHPALVSKLPIGPICWTRGKPEFLRFTRETGRYLVGPTVEVRGSVDRSTGNFAKAKPSRAAHRTCSQPVGERETTRKSPLPAEYRFRPRVARRTSTQDCQRQRYLESAADQPCGRQLGDRMAVWNDPGSLVFPARATGAGSTAFHEHGALLEGLHSRAAPSWRSPRESPLWPCRPSPRCNDARPGCLRCRRTP
jgi:hypothetical protein